MGTRPIFHDYFYTFYKTNFFRIQECYKLYPLDKTCFSWPCLQFALIGSIPWETAAGNPRLFIIFSKKKPVEKISPVKEVADRNIWWSLGEFARVANIDACRGSGNAARRYHGAGTRVELPTRKGGMVRSQWIKRVEQQTDLASRTYSTNRKVFSCLACWLGSRQCRGISDLLREVGRMDHDFS